LTEKNYAKLIRKKFHATKINKNLNFARGQSDQPFQLDLKIETFSLQCFDKKYRLFLFRRNYLDFNSNTTAIFSRTVTKANFDKR